ncbi:MAG: hypothetical protein WCH44_01740 [Betaproteobacteria bacterium]
MRVVENEQMTIGEVDISKMNFDSKSRDDIPKILKGLLALAGLCSRFDNAGVTSFVRVLNFGPQAYHRFLHLFHSDALDLDMLTSCWARLCLKLFRPFEVGSRLVLLADGIKAPKEGKRMPGVKMLHQQSASNTKPEYIMGHSLQAISLLVHSAAGQVAAVPLTSRIHEGLVFSNRDTSTLLDKLVTLLTGVARCIERQVLLIADAYYASGKVITPLLKQGHHLIREPRAMLWLTCLFPSHNVGARAGLASMAKKYGLRIWPTTTALWQNPKSTPAHPARSMGRTMSRYVIGCWIWCGVRQEAWCGL